MTTHPDLTPYAVALHLPFVRSELLLDRRSLSVDRVLHLLASAQVEAQGEPVQLGMNRIRDAGGDRRESVGVANSVRRTLYDLEERGVVWRYRGRARRPNAWSFNPKIGHWKAMPWKVSAGSVVERVAGCPCARSIRAASALFARFAGQSVAHMENSAEFAVLSRAEHLRTGLFLVETRDWGERRANRASAQAREPCGNARLEPGDNSQLADPVLFASLGVGVLLSGDAEEEEKFAHMVKVVNHYGIGDSYVYANSEPEHRLRALCARLTPGEVRSVAKDLDQGQTKTKILDLVAAAEQLGATRLARRRQAFSA